jgi:hypothetical protein
MVGRRGELLAELLLQEFGPAFVARPTADLGYDFFVGFPNSKGGINIAAVEVKSTEQPVKGRFPIPKRLYRRLANSNVPVLLLVVDVKQNRLFYALQKPDVSDGGNEANKMLVDLTEIDDKEKAELRSQLAGPQESEVGDQPGE